MAVLKSANFWSLTGKKKEQIRFAKAMAPESQWGFLVIGLCLLLGTGCGRSGPLEVSRPTDPWVRRSVLDQRPRMVTLALFEDRFAAYDTERCLPYKIWRGGVHWVGAAFNNIKTVQPTSWGNTYFLQSDTATTWEFRTTEHFKVATPRFGGYRLINNQLIFEYFFTLPGGEELTVYERPEWVDEHIFEQTFTVEEIPGNVELRYRGLVLKTGQTSKLENRFDPVPLPRKPSLHLAAHGSRYWLDRSGCNTCHEENEKTIGPGYRQIAGRYADDENAVDKLVRKVREGGVGEWGDAPMKPHPELADEDIARMVQYILTLKPREVKPRPESLTSGTDREMNKTTPGFGAPLAGIHPGLELRTIRPDGFRPRVGGIDFLPDGTLLISTWDSIGAVYALSGGEYDDTSRISIRRIASGLAEPLGLKVVDGEIFVMQKQELTQLLDHDGDGITDEYRNICNSFGVTADFHEYSYGLVAHQGEFFATLGLAMRLMSHEIQHPDRGSVIRIGKDGRFSKIAVGLRQPNGIAFGPDGHLVVTDNQGRWVPANKVIVIEEGAFYGCRKESGGAFTGMKETPPAVWLPQDEIGNSPSQPVAVPAGIYRGQFLHGEVTHGGIKRVFLEEVNDRWQGAVFRFTQGLEAGINRMVWGPDGALYVGGVGMTGGWSWQEHQFGLQKLVFTNKPVFEMLAVRAIPGGLEIEFGAALDIGAGDELENYQLMQWRYEATDNYGGPKLDVEPLEVREVTVSEDRYKVRLFTDGIKSGRVIHILLDEALVSDSGESLWSGECWYTMNQVPAEIITDSQL